MMLFNCKFPALLLLVMTITVSVVTGQVKSLRTLAEWKMLEYEFPSEDDRAAALASQEYIPGNGVPIDNGVYYNQGASGSRVFVTVPRFTTGVPITLGTLSGQHTPNGPIIRAYPSFSWNSNQGQNCNGITSVYRIAIDECRRLWVLDTGKLGDAQVCSPQLIVFNLDDDQVVQQYKFPSNVYRTGPSLFITPIVDVRDPTPGTATTCPNTMVYIADVTGFGIVVYDFQQNRSWRLQNKFFYPNPHFGTFTIAGESFDLMDGVFGLAVSPKIGQRSSTSGAGYRFPRPNSMLTRPSSPGTSERLLYFHAMAGTTENAIPLRLVDNSTIWDNDPDSLPRSFVELGNRGTQSPAQAMDRNGNLFFGLIDPIAVGCWDTHRNSYGRDSIKVVAQNDETLQFTSGLKIVPNNKGNEELWVTSVRFQRIAAGTRDNNEVNYRIQAAEVNTLLNGQTRCNSVGAPASMYSLPQF